MAKNRDEIRGFWQILTRSALAAIGGMLAIPILAIFLTELNLMLHHYIAQRVALCRAARVYPRGRWMISVSAMDGRAIGVRSPLIDGQELEMQPLLDHWISPAVRRFAVMMGGAIGGVIRVYLSVPLVAVRRVVLSHPVYTKSNEVAKIEFSQRQKASRAKR